MPSIRWTIVTGASSGIGADLARQFSAIGHNLILVARRRAKLQALADELRERDRGLVEIMEFDLTKAKAPQALFDAVQKLDVPVHTLVNNAGFGLRGDFVELSIDEQLEMMNINMTALTKLSHLFLPGMIERKHGGIINVSSTAAFQAGPHMAVYYASKAFVLSLSEALHEEVKPHGVTVTALCPGPTESGFGERAGMDGTKLFQRGKMTSERVAEIGVEGYRAGHAIVVTGIQNRFASQMSRLLPRFLTRRVAKSLQSSP
jgi:uncharacterized protein